MWVMVRPGLIYPHAVEGLVGGVLGIIVLYWVIRTAVAGGIRDARTRAEREAGKR